MELDMLVQELRHALRLLVRDRAVTVAALLTLALAIGANTAVFNVLEAVRLRPMPIARPDRVVVAWQTAVNGTRLQAVFSYPDYRDWRAVAHAVERTALISWSTGTVSAPGESERLQAAAVTPGFFELLGVSVEGRVFSETDTPPGAEPVAIVTDLFRRNHFAAVGQPIGALMTMNGVERRGGGGIASDPPDGGVGPRTDIWIPIQQRPQLEGRGNRNFTALGRLAPGARVADAQRELAAVMNRLGIEYPATNAGRGARVIGLREQLSSDSRRGVTLAGAAALVLLLVACANVGSLLLARGLTRTQEFATRAALGASRLRIVRQILIETLVLSLAGAACGLALFAVAVPLLRSALPSSLPRVFLIGWHPRLALFAAAIACVAAMAAALPLAWRLGRAETGTGARATRGAGGARHVLAAAQIATAAAVLLIAGLLGTSLVRLQQRDTGFPAERMATLQVQLGGPAYDTEEKCIAFVDRLLARVEALPTVRRAAVIDPAPFSGHINRWDVQSDAGVPVFKTDRYTATPSAFDVLSVRPLRGRVFESSERTSAVVDNVFAAQAFPGQDPIGRTFKLENNPPRTIVGIVPHIKHYGLDEAPRPQVYLPFASDPSDWLNVLIDGRLDAAAALADARHVVRDLDAAIPPYDATTLRSLVNRSFQDRQLAARLAMALGAITLIVAAAGLFGTMQFLVTRRVREIGVRLALGARPRGVIRLILGAGVRVTAAGHAAGIPAGLIATRAVRALLFDTAPFDAGVYAAVIALLVFCSLVAAIVPAWRASRIDPLQAIRSE